MSVDSSRNSSNDPNESGRHSRLVNGDSNSPAESGSRDSGASLKPNSKTKSPTGVDGVSAAKADRARAFEAALARGVADEEFERGNPQIADVLKQLNAVFGSSPQPSGDPEFGVANDTLGRFELVEELGRGRFGVVYLALDPKLKRHVAIKQAHTHIVNDPSLRSRFVREGESLALLDHPGIVRVFETEQDGPLCYLVMEYCEGGTLERWLDDGVPCPVTMAAQIIRDVARAVQHGHEAGVVHRDLKPANVLLATKSQTLSSSNAGAEVHAAQLESSSGEFEAGLQFESTAIHRVSSEPQHASENLGEDPTHDRSSDSSNSSLPIVRRQQDSGNSHPNGECRPDTRDSTDSSVCDSSFESRELPWTPRVVDFGLARFIEDDVANVNQTRASMIVGTPLYMAPEQAGVTQDAIGPGTDVFALGAILYELLTGAPPFKADSLTEIVRLLKQCSPKRIRSINADVPLDLEVVCLKALERTARDRFLSAGDLADELDRFLVGKPVVARPITTTQRLWKWCRRNRMLSSFAVSFLTVLVVFTVWLSFFAINLNSANTSLANSLTESQRLTKETQRLNNEANVARASAVARQRIARDLLYASDMASASEARLSGQSRTLRTLIRRHRPANSGDDQRGFEWYYTSQKGMPNEVATFQHDHECLAVAWSPDGRMIASADVSGLVQLIDAGSFQAIHSIQAMPGAIRSLAFSPDSQILAVCQDVGGVTLFDASTGQLVRHMTGLLNAAAAVFNTDGTRLFAAGDSMDIKNFALTLQVGPGAPPTTLKGHTGRLWALAVSPDGRLLASGGEDNQVKLWQLPMCDEVAALRSSTHRVTSLAFSPDNRLLAVGTTNHLIELWDTNSERRVNSINLLNNPTDLHFSSDGRRLHAVDQGGNVNRWEFGSLSKRYSDKIARHIVASPDGEFIVVARWHDARLINTRLGTDSWISFRSEGIAQDAQHSPHHRHTLVAGFASDSKRFVCGNEVFEIDAETRQAQSIAVLETNEIGRVIISSDGKRVINGSGNGELNLLDAVSGKLLDQIFLPFRVHVSALGISEDGDVLATGQRSGWVSVVGLISKGQPDVVDAKTEQSNKLDWIRRFQFPRQPEDHSITSVAVSSTSRRIAAGTSRGGIAIWNLDTGALISDIQPFGNAVNSLQFSAAGDRLLVASSDQVAGLLNIEQRHFDKTWPARYIAPVAAFAESEQKVLVSGCDGFQLMGRSLQVRKQGELTTWPIHDHKSDSIDMSPSGNEFVTAGRDGRVVVTQLTPRISDEFIDAPGFELYDFQFVADQSQQVLFSGANGLGLMDLPTGKITRMLDETTKSPFIFASSDDCRFFMTNSAGELLFWNSDSNELVRHPDKTTSSGDRMCEMPDSNQVAISCFTTNEIRIVDLDSGKITRQLKSRSVRDVAVTSNGQWLITNDLDDLVVFDLSSKSRRPARRLKGHTSSVYRIAINPTNTWCASAGDDQTIRVWDLHTNKLIHTMEGHALPIESIEFSGNGRTLVSASEDGTVRLWHVNTGQQVAQIDTLDEPHLVAHFGSKDRALGIVTAGRWLQMIELDDD